MQLILTDECFHKQVMKDQKPVLVDLKAAWCGTCHIMTPILYIHFHNKKKYSGYSLIEVY